MGLGQRFAQAMASSMSLTSQIEKPATSSRALGERPVDDRAAGTIEDDALGLGAVLEAGGGHEDAGLDQLLGEPVHRRERLGAWGARPFRCPQWLSRTP